MTVAEKLLIILKLYLAPAQKEKRNEYRTQA